ncbi:hypothetical protein [Faucicola boevrei]|uniref:hypothetical protein n=1 Tax=Faucicola boevrei TaxID=346665 RepID=UPI000376C987|nr:hypothetical protein [Moraxella boevrei]
MAKTTRRKTTETPDTTTIENDVSNTDVLDNQDVNITQDNDVTDTDDVTENHADDEIQTDNTPVEAIKELASLATEESEINSAINDVTTIEPKNTITVINNASRDFLEPATRTLLKSGEMTEIVLTVSKERIIGNLNQLNYLHGNCLVIGGDL